MIIRNLTKNLLIFFSKKDVIAFIYNLAIMLSAGIPIIHSLELIASTYNKVYIKDQINKVILELEHGKSLAVALSKHMQSFKSAYIQLINIGENIGKLDYMLFEISKLENKWLKLKQHCYKATIYPLIIVITALISCFFIFMFVIPEFSKIYNELNADLPYFTQYAIYISFLINKYYLLIIFTLIIIFSFSLKMYVSKQKLYFFCNKYILKLPIFGKIIQKLEISKIFNTLYVCNNAGMPLDESLVSISKLAINPLYKESILNIKQSISHGKSLSYALTITRQFPSIITNMIKLSEETGNLDEILLKITTIFEEEATNNLDKIIVLLEPILMFVVGTIILCIILAIYLPIINLGATI